MRRILTMAAALFLGFAGAAAAVEGHAEEGGANLFGGDLGNVIWTWLIFLLVVVVLGRFAWRPLLAVLQRREEFIRESLEQAQHDREEAEKSLAERSRQLKEAHRETKEILEEGRRDAEALRVRLEGEAHEEAERMLERARREIETAKTTALRELYTASARLATDVAARVLEREVSAADHERLIAKAIDELGEKELN